MKTANRNKLTFGRYDYAAFLTFACYAASAVVIPVVLVNLADDLGFTLDEGGMSAAGALQFLRVFPMMTAMLLCGFIAGKFGKRRAFGASVLLMGIGIGLCSIAPAYGFLVLALLLAGLGEGTIEGLATPFVRDLHPKESGRYINFTHGFWSVGVLIAVLASGALLSADVSWRLILGGVALLCMIPAFMILLPASQNIRYPEHPESLSAGSVWRNAASILRVRKFWWFFAAMFLAGGGEFCLTFWAASYTRLHFNTSAWMGGVATAIFAGGMILGRIGWSSLLHQKHLKGLIVWSAMGGTVVTVLLPILMSPIVFFILLFLSGLATAPFWPSVQSYCADCMPKSDTTMLFILLSCAGVPGCGFFTFLSGIIADRFGSLTPALYLVPFCYVLLGLIISCQNPEDGGDVSD